jgi:hypothetical protein
MDTTRSHRPQPLQIVPVISLGVAAVALASLAVFTLGSGRGETNAGPVLPPPSAAPTALAVAPTSSPVPTDEPTPAATPVPTTAEPSEEGADAMPIRVDLANANGADVYVDIVDHTGLLVDAASGTPGDGASIEAYTVKVENLGPTTLRLSWMDYPIDNALALYIDRVEDGFRFVLVQPEPTGTTDAMGVDRELVLTFSQPISAAQVETFLQGGLDTPG